MKVDSPEQKQLLQEILENTSFTAKPDTLGQIATNIQALRVALSNATVEEVKLELEAEG